MGLWRELLRQGSFKGAVVGAVGGAIGGGISGYYGDTWSAGRVMSHSVGGG